MKERLLLVLLFLTVLLIAADPGRVPLFEPDEGRYAEIPREMLSTGDFVTPRLDGVLYFEKPPLHYWTVAASFAVFGLTEFAARVPTKLASIGLVLLAYLFARRRFGEATGRLAALLVATSVLVFALARITIIDPSLSFAMAASAFAFAAFQEHEAALDAPRARRALYGLHLSCALAVMLKGLIGIVLPGGAIVVFVLVTGRYRLLPKLFSPGPLLLFLALTVPWHVLVAQRNPDFLKFYFVHEHFQRFATKEHRREGSPLYFVAVLLAGFLPWSGFFGSLRRSWPGFSREAFAKRSTEGFLFVYAVIVFLFFSASKSKLIPYLEPIWPAVAVLLALGIQRARESGASFRAARAVTAFLFAALFVAGVVFAFGVGYAKRFDIVPPSLLVLAGLLVGFLLALAPFGAIREGWSREPVLFVAAPWLLFLLGGFLAFGNAARAVTPWPLVEATLREAAPGETVVQRRHYLEVLPFYLRKTTPIAALGWSELDFGREHAPPAGTFLTDEEFSRLWNGSPRVLVVGHRDALRDFADPKLGLAPPRVLGRDPSGKHYLFSNREAGAR